MRKTRFNGLGIVLFLVILTFLWAATAVSHEKQLLAAIDKRRGAAGRFHRKFSITRSWGSRSSRVAGS